MAASIAKMTVYIDRDVEQIVKAKQFDARATAYENHLTPMTLRA